LALVVEPVPGTFGALPDGVVSNVAALGAVA
jgi:hypothetical protein